jgi:Ca2+-binding EF-hand superfamily protein
VKEFLAMVTVLSVKQMSQTTIEQLHQLFVDHAEKTLDGEYHLWRDDLASLMRTLNHPEDEVELEFLMKEWDIESKGYLDFDAFVSIVAHVLKSEELDEQLEKDFLYFCGETNVQQVTVQQMSSAITAADIVRVAREKCVFIDHDLAEEMIFDADETGTGQLCLDHLIACIETVGADEAFHNFDDDEDDDESRRSSGTLSERGDSSDVGDEGTATTTLLLRESGGGSTTSGSSGGQSRHALVAQKMKRIRDQGNSMSPRSSSPLERASPHSPRNTGLTTIPPSAGESTM